MDLKPGAGETLKTVCGGQLLRLVLTCPVGVANQAPSADAPEPHPLTSDPNLLGSLDPSTVVPKNTSDQRPAWVDILSTPK